MLLNPTEREPRVQEAFSRLTSITHAQGLTTAALVRRVQDQGDRVNPKSIYRLADPEEPLEKVDMRVIAAVCQALNVGIAEILTFDAPTIIEAFSQDKQSRMEDLMARHSSRAGEPLDAAGLTELQELVDEAESISRGNARRLANRKRRLSRTATPVKPIAS